MQDTKPTTIKPRMTAASWEVRDANTGAFLGLISRDFYTNKLSAFSGRGGHTEVPPLDSGDPDFSSALADLTDAKVQS